MAQSALNEMEQARAGAGLPVPHARYSSEDLAHLEKLAAAYRNPGLVLFAYEAGRGELLLPARLRQTAERAVAQVFVAKLEMVATQNSAAGVAAYDRAREYYRARLAVASEPLRKLEVMLHDVAPQFDKEELSKLKLALKRMKGGRERRELVEALRRAEEAAALRQERRELASRRPLSDRETAALYGQALVARAGLEAVEARIRGHKAAAPFKVYEFEEAGGEIRCSLFQVYRAIELNGESAKHTELKEMIEQEINLERNELEDNLLDVGLAHFEVEDRMIEAVRVREAHGLEVPEPEFTPQLLRDLDECCRETRNLDALDDLTRAEASRDIIDAAGRSRAREIVATVELAHSGETSILYDKQLRESLSSLDPHGPAARAIGTYLDYRSAEQQVLGAYHETLRQVSVEQRQACVSETGHYPETIFRGGEVSRIEAGMHALEESERREIYDEINNRSWYDLGDNRIERAEIDVAPPALAHDREETHLDLVLELIEPGPVLG
jgi:hypothetical protein